jgi:hypothetical protein
LINKLHVKKLLDGFETSSYSQDLSRFYHHLDSVHCRRIEAAICREWYLAKFKGCDHKVKKDEVSRKGHAKQVIQILTALIEKKLRIIIDTPQFKANAEQLRDVFKKKKGGGSKK